MRKQPKKWCVGLCLMESASASGLWLEDEPGTGIETLGSDVPLTRYSVLEDDGESLLLWLTDAEVREFRSLWEFNPENA